MRKNVLPNGCETCADQLRARNFQGLLAAQFDPVARSRIQTQTLQVQAMIRTGNPALYPARMEFELSNKCNLECSMCTGFFSSSIRSNREGLPPLPQLYDGQFVEQLRPFVPHLKEAKFFGGEPFLVDLYYEIWELFLESNPACNIAITTNGTVFTEKVKRVLEKLNCQIVVSLDSLIADTYEGIRKNAVLARTLDNLESFTAINRRRNKSLWLAVCPMVTNWQEIPEIVSFANRRQMCLFFNTVLFPKELSLKHLSLSEHEDILNFLSQSLRSPANPTEEHNNRALADLCHLLEMWMKEQPSLPSSHIREKCRHYLEGFVNGTSDPMYSVLSALATKGMRGPAIVPISAISGDGDPGRNIREHYTAIWNVGAMLTADGLLPGAGYGEDKLQAYLNFLETSFERTTLKQIHQESMCYVMEVLLMAGANSARELIEQTKTHYSAGLRFRDRSRSDDR